MDAEQRTLKAEYKSAVLREIFTSSALILAAIAPSTWLIYFAASDRYARKYVVGNIEREFHKSANVALKLHKVPLPHLHVLTHEDSGRNQLEECGIEFRKNEPFGYCSGTVYLNYEYVALAATHIFPSPLDVFRAFRFRSSEEMNSRHLELTSELAVAMSVIHHLNLSTDKTERKKIQYCSAARAMSLTNANNSQIRDSIIRDLRLIARQTVDDISPNEQVAAFEKGWSGEACY